MCAPHKATLAADCTAQEAAGLLLLAGLKLTPTFADAYLTGATPANETAAYLATVAERKEILMNIHRHPDTLEGGILALEELRAVLSGMQQEERKAEGGPVIKSCCGGGNSH